MILRGVVVLALVALLVTPLDTAAAGRASTVSRQHTPSWHAPQTIDPISGGFTSISCATPTFCRAGANAGQIWRWDGTSWLRGTNFGAAYEAASMSCPTTTFCAAILRVDDERYRPVTLHGTQWDVSAAKRGRGGATVSCVNERFCITVTTQGSVQRYNGSTWSEPARQVSPSYARSVSCATTTMCVSTSGAGTVTEYDGSTWSEDERLDPVGLGDVDCPTPSYCIALSTYNRVLRYDGTEWSDVHAPAPNHYRLVSCADEQRCTVTVDGGRVVDYDGNEWTDPEPVDAEAGFAGIACPAADWCAVVSSLGSAAIRRDSSWSAPRRIAPLTGLPTSISCASPTSCLMVDELGATRSFDGRHWSAPRRFDNTSGAFTDVSCNGPRCTAVDDNNHIYTRIDGRWQLPYSVPVGGAQLAAVSCTAASFCAFVSNLSVEARVGTRWIYRSTPHNSWRDVSCGATFCVAVAQNGAVSRFVGHWTEAKSPGGYRLQVVSCVSSSFCMGVTENGYALRFDGTGWTQVSSGSRAIPNDSISCSSATSCTAVRHSGASSWGGTRWAEVDDILPPSVTQSTISCRASRCIAVSMAGSVAVRD